MPLTPEDVRNKRFSPVRLRREGYDMGEVDRFLDEVEAELVRLTRENDDLRSKLGPGLGGSEALPTSDQTEQTEQRDKADKRHRSGGPQDGGVAEVEATAAKAPAEPAAVAPAPTSETTKAGTPAEASSTALRLLELATKNADEFVAEAKQQAEQIVGSARTEAERLELETRTRAEAVDREARARAHNLDAETEARRQELISRIEQEKTRLAEEVDTLRAFEREYRSRLRSYFTEQLEALDGVGEEADPAAPGEGAKRKRLRSILGDAGGTRPDDADAPPRGGEAPPV